MAIDEGTLVVFCTDLKNAIEERLTETARDTPEVLEEEEQLLRKYFADFNGYTLVQDVCEADG
jgi:hypothetical protein